MSKQLKSIIREAAEETPIEVSEETLQLFERYFNEIKRFSRAYSLTSLDTEEEFAIKGILDSLLYLIFFPSSAEKVLDVGSGAGLPGLVIKIARPDLKVHLMEPSRKKAAFLRHIITKLHLRDVDVIEDTIESYSKTSPEWYDILLTRALFSVGEFIKKGFPLLKEGGILIMSKGPGYERELKRLKTDRPVEVHPVRLPVVGLQRYFLIVQNN